MRLIMIALILILIPLISGQVETLGIFKQGDCIILKQTCGDCTYNNITSVTFPNGSTAVNEKVMTKIGTEYNYTYCLTEPIGTYIVNGKGDLSGTTTVWSYDFKITRSGSELNTGQSIIYFFAVGLLLILFTLSLFFAITIPFKNERSNGKVVSINYLKYLKISMMVSSYIFLLFLSGIVRAITENMLVFNGVFNFFRLIYWTLFSLMIPIVVIIGFTVFVNFIMDAKLHKKMQRGFFR